MPDGWHVVVYVLGLNVMQFKTDLHVQSNQIIRFLLMQHSYIYFQKFSFIRLSGAYKAQLLSCNIYTSVMLSVRNFHPIYIVIQNQY